MIFSGSWLSHEYAAVIFISPHFSTLMLSMPIFPLRVNLSALKTLSFGIPSLQPEPVPKTVFNTALFWGLSLSLIVSFISRVRLLNIRLYLNHTFDLNISSFKVSPHIPKRFLPPVASLLLRRSNPKQLYTLSPPSASVSVSVRATMFALFASSIKKSNDTLYHSPSVGIPSLNLYPKFDHLGDILKYLLPLSSNVL